jgi:hypothetical protein
MGSRESAGAGGGWLGHPDGDTEFHQILWTQPEPVGDRWYVIGGMFEDRGGGFGCGD